MLKFEFFKIGSVTIEKLVLFHKENKTKIKQRMKLYREKNKDSLREQNRLYREKNKDSIREKAKITYTCACGSTLTKAKRRSHERSKKHLKYIESIK